MIAKDKIIKLYQLSGLSIRYFASVVGLSSSYLKSILTGDKEPSSSDIKKVAETFGLPLNGFVNPDTEVIRKNQVMKDTILFVEK